MIFDNQKGKMQQAGGGGKLGNNLLVPITNQTWKVSIFFLLFSVFSGNLSVSAAIYEWNGGEGSWNDSSSWNPTGTPTNDDTATIASGKVTTSSQSLSRFTLNLNNGELEMNGDDFTLNSNSHVYQTGGTFSLTNAGNCWLNIGESTGLSSSYTISGGKLELSPKGNSYLVVGRRGEGHLTVSGADTTVETNRFMLGWSTQLSGNSSVNLNGGTLTVNGISYIGGDGNQEGSQAGVNTFTINGGTYLSQGDVQIGNYKSAADSVKTLFQQQSGIWTANGIVKIGTGDVTEGKSNQANVQIAGGTATFNNHVYLGDGIGVNATMTLSGGITSFQKEVVIGRGENSSATMVIQDTAQVTFGDKLQVGYGANADAKLNISGGNTTFNGLVYLGDGTNAQGTVTLSGGITSFQKEVVIGRGENSSATMVIQDTAQVTFGDKLQVGYGANADAKLNISGGNTTFNGPVEIGSQPGVAGNFNISGGNTTFTKQVSIGTNSGTGNLNISGGTTTFNLTGATLDIGNLSGATGKLTISGDETKVSFTGYDIHVGKGGTGSIVQTGGSFTISGWLNIGENGTGSYTLSGGTLTSNVRLVVGRRGEGTMTVSGTGKIEANNVYVGYFPDLSKNSTLLIQGGEVSGKQLFIGNQAENSAGEEKGVSTMTIQGGKATFSQTSYIGHTGYNKTGGTGILNVEGGVFSFLTNVDNPGHTYIGYGSKGHGTVNVTNGNLLFNETATLGHSSGQGTLNVSGGEVSFNKTAYIGASSGQGVLNISGGKVSFNNVAYIGASSGQGTILITGGTLYGPYADFVLGHENTLAKMTIDGGTYNQNSKGNLVIRSTTVNGDVGTLVELKSGTLDTLWLSLGQGGDSNGTCTFNMTGGNLKIGSGNFRVGHQHHGTANIHGGSIEVGGTLLIAGEGKGGNLNVYGSDSTWSVGTVDWRSTGTANFMAGGLTFQADGTAKPALSTIVSQGNASVNSHVGVDMSDYYYTGAGFMNTLPSQQLLTASSLTWNPASVTVQGDWLLSVENNAVELKLDETKIAMADVTSGSGVAAGILGTRGWVQILGEANSLSSLFMFYEGEGDGDLLAQWLTEQLDETQQEITIRNTGCFIEFANLLLDADGMGYLSYNIDAFNALHDMNLTFTNLPEPSTWVLLFSGLIFFFWKRGIRREK